jgi:hypothetical protein
MACVHTAETILRSKLKANSSTVRNERRLNHEARRISHSVAKSGSDRRRDLIFEILDRVRWWWSLIEYVADNKYRNCIGILNHPFFWPEQYRRTGRMSIVFLFDENPDVASAGSGGAAVGGARSVPDHSARSNSERAAPSARVGNRFSAPQIVWNRSNRCAGARGGARLGRPRWLACRKAMAEEASRIAALYG